ncbi:MAG: hypothetical protein ACYC5Q_02675 [Thermoleophilia bacterium]
MESERRYAQRRNRKGGMLRSQLEEYIIVEFGSEHLARIKNELELRTLKKQISEAKKQLNALELRKKELEG